jgi:recombinational DNA repair protein (RecF pathway)
MLKKCSICGEDQTPKNFPFKSDICGKCIDELSTAPRDLQRERLIEQKRLQRLNDDFRELGTIGKCQARYMRQPRKRIA